MSESKAWTEAEEAVVRRVAETGHNDGFDESFQPLTMRRALATLDASRAREAELTKALADRSAPCEDLRHVCGGCGFRWPERSAYDDLTAQVRDLREALAAMTRRAEGAAEDARHLRHALNEVVGRRPSSVYGDARFDNAVLGAIWYLSAPAKETP